jgi:hypothetical protein
MLPVQEISAAFWSSMLISPCMMMIDLSIHRSHQHTEKGIASFIQTAKDLRNRRIPFWKSYIIMSTVYFLTFGTANVSEYYHMTPLFTLGLTTTANVSAMAYKDRYYSSLWGTTLPLQYLPWKSRCLSTVGALGTIYAQFVQRKPLEKHMINAGVSSSGAAFLSSVLICSAAQTVSTPFHLLSMDFYRYPNETLWKRFIRIRAAYTTVCTGRMLRILPAFGGGGYLNERWKCQKIYYDAK